MSSVSPVAEPSVTAKFTLTGFSDASSMVRVTSWLSASPALASDAMLISGASSSFVMVYSQVDG